MNLKKFGGKDYNKPLGKKELIKFKKLIHEKHHIDIDDIISQDLKLKKLIVEKKKDSEVKNVRKELIFN